MSKQDFKARYRDLEMEVMAKLREAVTNSTTESKYIQGNVLRVSGNFKELAVLHDRLTFIDSNGCNWSIFEFSLEELIDLIPE